MPRKNFFSYMLSLLYYYLYLKKIINENFLNVMKQGWQMIRNSATIGKLNDFEELFKPVNKLAIYFSRRSVKHSTLRVFKYTLHLYTFCCSVPSGKCATRLSRKASGGQLCSTSTDLSVAVYSLSLNESLKATDNFIQDLPANCGVILRRNLTFQ